MNIVKTYFFIMVSIVFMLTSASSAKIHIDDRSFISSIAASNRTHVTLLVAMKENLLEEEKIEFYNYLIERDVLVKYKDTYVGYYRIMVPLNYVHEIARHPSVLAVNVSRGSAYVKTSPSSAALGQLPQVQPKLNLEHYLKTARTLDSLHGMDEIGVARLQKRNPSYDGRGVTIAILELIPDMGAAELAVAKTLDGKPVAKYAAAYALPAPPEPTEIGGILSKSRGTIRFSYFLNAQHNVISDKGRQIFVPVNGQYQLAYLDETEFSSSGNDLNKDGNPKDRPRTFAIARRQGDNCLFVDVNQNDDLRDDPCISDYNDDPGISRFISATKGKKGAPFIVLKTLDPNAWVIGIPMLHTHLAHLAAAGDQFFGSNLSSPAPAARLVPVYVPLTHLEGVIEGALRVAYDPSVDIIHLEVVNELSFSHSSTVPGIILSRIVTMCNKVLTAPVGNNGAKVATMTVESAASKVIGVGQFYSDSAQNLLLGKKNRGGLIPALSSSGPTEDGRVKPDLVAPSLGVFPLTDAFESTTEEIRRSNTIACPNIITSEAFSCFTGTSMAGPMAAGAIAVLISAAKQEGIKYSASDIIDAVTMSARHSAGAPVHKQGNGVIDVFNALKWLQKSAKRSLPRIVVSAPVATKLSHDLSPPNVGHGVFEYEGWVAGSSGVRNIKVRRVSGDRNRAAYNLTLIGNENGTFKVGSKIVLPLGEQVLIPVKIKPHHNGDHSALLQIEFDGDPIARVPLTVIAAPPLSRQNGFRLELDAKSDASKFAAVYFYVPPGVVALRARHIPNIRSTAPALLAPTGTIFPEMDMDDWVDGASEVDKLGPTNSQTVYYPTPGVWQYIIGDRSINAREQVKYRIEIEAVPEVKIKEVNGLLAIANEYDGSRCEGCQGRFRYNEVRGSYVSGIAKLNIDDIPKIVDFNLPQDVMRIDARVVLRNYKDTTYTGGANVNIMLFKCIEDKCAARGGSTGTVQAGLIAYSPSAGKWRLAIDGSRSVSDGAILEYELFASIKDGGSANIDMVGQVNLSQRQNANEYVESVVPKQVCFTEIISEDFTFNRFKADDKEMYVGQKNVVPLNRVLGCDHYFSDGSVK